MRLPLALILGLVALSSCGDKSSQGSDQPTTLDAISDAQDKALDKVDILNINPGQFAYVLKTQELYSSQQPIENLVEESAMTVTDREEFGPYFDITVIKESIDHIAKDKPHYKFKSIYTIDYPEAATPTALSPRQSLKQKLKDQLSAMVSKASTEEPETKVDFYNLRVVEEKISPPKKVLEHSPCSTGSNCLINVTKLFYTVVFTIPDQAAQRNELELWLSTDVPYFATILKSCATGLIQIDTALPAIRQCESIYDYSFTALPTP